MYVIRKFINEYGLELFLDGGYLNIVIVFKVLENIGVLKFKNYMLKKYNILIIILLELYNDIIFRIGYMGENVWLEKIIYVLNVIDNGLKDLGFKFDKELVILFNKYLKD